MSGTGQFQTANGQIIGPNGNVFSAQGINVYDSQMGAASQILSDFPGLNLIRLNCYSYQSPSAYASFIQTMSAAGVVVELEDHINGSGNAGGAQGSAFTGSQLTAESNWYASLASTYASNPYVWFGTNNEPPTAGLTTWEQATYNAIRGAGNNNPIMMELPGGGDPGNTLSSYGMNPGAYTSMTNIIADPHFYGWSSGYSTNQGTVNSALTNLVQGAQTMQSANGTVPVIIGEYGPATDGVNTDVNASQTDQAVQSATDTSGAVAWGFDSGANDNLTNGAGALTSYGQEVAGSFTATPPTAAAAIVTVPTTTAGATLSSIPAAATLSSIPAAATLSSIPAAASGATPSANDTVVLGTAGAITDASGNDWSITSGGQVAVNGATDPTTAGVTELAYVNGNVWQENTNNLWWDKSNPAAAWAPPLGTSTGPLTASATPTTVSQSQVSIAATSADPMLYVTGTGDQITLSGGNQTISDTGGGNTYILPAAGNGNETFTNNILTGGDTLDLTTALGATDWNGSAGSLANYLSVTDNAQGATLSIAPTSGGAGVAIATINGAISATLSDVLAHSLT